MVVEHEPIYSACSNTFAKLNLNENPLRLKDCLNVVGVQNQKLFQNMRHNSQFCNMQFLFEVLKVDWKRKHFLFELS